MKIKPVITYIQTPNGWAYVLKFNGSVIRGNPTDNQTKKQAERSVRDEIKSQQKICKDNKCYRKAMSKLKT